MPATSEVIDDSVKIRQPIAMTKSSVPRRVSSAGDRLAALLEESERLGRDLAVASERERLYAQQIAASQQEEEALISRRQILEEEVARARADLAEHRDRRSRCLSEIETLRQELASADAERARLTGELQGVERRIAARERESAQLQAQNEQLDEREHELEAERGELRSRSESAVRQLEILRGQAAELDVRESELEAQLALLEQQQTNEETALLAVREQLVSLERAASEARSHHDALLSRQRALQRQRDQMSEYHPGVRLVLRSSEELTGVRGTVASLMRVPREYEQAIQSALGTRLQNIVTDRWEDAEAAIALLKQRQAGWATFLPLDTLQVRPPLQNVSRPGVVGVASELVRYNAEFSPVYDLLLGHILVTQDLATARRLLRERTGASLLVTLEGETVQPSGAVSGGARQVQTQILAQEREWRELPARVQAAKDRLHDAAAAVSAHQLQIADLQTAIRDRSRQIAEQRAENDMARRARQKHEDALARAEREASWQNSRAAQIAEDLAQLAVRQTAASAAMDRLSRQGEDLAASLSEITGRRDAIQDGPARHRLNALETEAEVNARTYRSVAALVESHVRNVDQVDSQLSLRRGHREEQQARLKEVETLLAEGWERLQALEARIEEARSRIDPLRRQRAELEREEQSTVRLHGDSLERLHEAETEFNQVVLERDRARDQQISLSIEIEESLGPIDLPDAHAHQLRLNLDDNVVELPRVVALPSGLSDEIRQLRARLRRVGGINPEAPREYEKLLERQTFLQSQISDLRGAIASLQEVIEELDEVIERDFGAAVERVDVSFARFFEELFGGGTAHLVLTDPTSLATTGVDIIAHPPGKHAQRLSLLSGGERALTAVALLFALLGANPVPFCFLDEVDAALDESNVGRFRDLLRSQAEATQYVVITHNRRTIEAAETIYGISMEDQGVSQSISLQISS